MTATVAQTPGAIGYIEYGYAKLTNTPAAELQNAAGNFVAPGGEGGQIALSGAEFKGDDLRAWITNPKEDKAYPIATFTWMLFYKKQDAAKAEALRTFVDVGTEGRSEDGRRSRLHRVAGGGGGQGHGPDQDIGSVSA